MTSVRKEPLAFALILIIVGFVLFYFSGTVVNQDQYALKASIDNNVSYAEGSPMLLSVSAHFDSGQRLFFNFTTGRYWGLLYDQENGMEPAMTNFAPNASINPYKIAVFYIYTPSNDTVVTEIYVVGGNQIYSVVYTNQSADFTPLNGRNCTFYNVGLEGIAQANGNYTLKIDAVDPPIRYDQTKTYFINSDPKTGDPPTAMMLYSIATAATKPYLVSGVFAGVLIISLGIILSVWALTPNLRKHRPHKSVRNRPHV